MYTIIDSMGGTNIYYFCNSLRQCWILDARCNVGYLKKTAQILRDDLKTLMYNTTQRLHVPIM